ncbi:hypothetical protein K503DRAFT_862837 [Rhizopogon vinicolor AM-OR11-026]|uniref:MYND-type domain-containing protein n=1 Tax=Rhizopogon vinicolor AM-OR11-026 TaxID=1314800 RepID=A0A1B7NCY1_9AGAM|nr:hypothetical protein K503DRAFT_862837 [Rhizopogon vinicolor AM-OR11-026]
MSSATPQRQPEDGHTFARVVQFMINKAASGSIKELDGLCNIAQHWNPEQLVILLPVFYHHLDPARIPDVVNSRDVRAIMLARYSLKGVLVTLDCVCSPDKLTHAEQTISNHLISNWHRCHPWINFFYRHFFASRSPARLPGLLVTRSEALKLVVNMLMRMGLIGDSKTPQSLVNTPSLHPIISQLWCMAITSKDNDFLVEADKVMGSQERGAFQEHMSYVVQTCLDVSRPLFTNTLIDVAGGIRTMASIAFRYIRNIRSLCRKILSRQSVDGTTPCDSAFGVPRCQMMLINCFGNCAVLLIVTSQQNSSLREAYIERNLVALVTYTLRDLCQLSLSLKHDEFAKHVKKAFEEALGYIGLLVLKGPVDDVVAVVCQALQARLLPTVLEAHAYIPGTDAEERMNALLISVFRSYLAFDKVLRIAGRELEAEEESLDAVAQCNADLLHSWNLFKKTVHRYLDLRSQIPAASIYFDRQCAATHNSDEWHPQWDLFQCAGCTVARYCSRQCQNTDWDQGHRTACKYLKAAIGPSASRYIRKSLFLLAKIEDSEIHSNQEFISQLWVTARAEHPEFQDRLVLEIDHVPEKPTDKFKFNPVSNYLHIFPEASERPWQVASEWRQSVGLHGPGLPAVVRIHEGDEIMEKPNLLFSPSTALRMAFTGHGLDARINDNASSIYHTGSSAQSS